MQSTDKQEFAVIMKATFEYYRVGVTSAAMDIYWNGLLRYEISDIRRALNLHIQNPDSGQFMPKVADVVKHLEGTTNTEAMLAWSKVEKAIRCIGTMQTVIFDDPLIHVVLSDMGGWIRMGTITTDEIPFVAKEFEKRYQGYRMKGGVSVWPRMLVGTSQAENERNGLKCDAPVMIGDPERGQKVLSGGSNSAVNNFYRRIDLEKVGALKLTAQA